MGMEHMDGNGLRPIDKFQLFAHVLNVMRAESGVLVPLRTSFLSRKLIQRLLNKFSHRKVSETLAVSKLFLKKLFQTPLRRTKFRKILKR